MYLWDCLIFCFNRLFTFLYLFVLYPIGRLFYVLSKTFWCERFYWISIFQIPFSVVELCVKFLALMELIPRVQGFFTLPGETEAKLSCIYHNIKGYGKWSWKLNWRVCGPFYRPLPNINLMIYRIWSHIDYLWNYCLSYFRSRSFWDWIIQWFIFEFYLASLMHAVFSFFQKKHEFV